MTIPSRLAGLRARAALGRPPQDRLEAACVLESWGVRPQAALRVAASGDGVPATLPLDKWTGRNVDDEASSIGESIGVVVGLVAAIVWTGAMVSHTHGAWLGDAWRWALPITFCLQWFIRRRYLATRSDGIRRLRGSRWLPIAALVIEVGQAVAGRLAVGVGAVIALVVVWTTGLLLSRRGWTPAYVVALAAGTAAFGHLSTAVVLNATCDAIVIAVALGVLTSPRSDLLPLPRREAALSGLVGLGLGIIMAEVEAPTTFTDLLALSAALVPALVGGLVWFWMLGELWPTIGASLAASDLHSFDRALLASTVRRILVLSAVGYVTVSAALSAVVVVVLRHWGLAHGTPVMLLVIIALLGLATAVLASLDALGRTGAALGVVMGAIAVGLLARTVGLLPGVDGAPALVAAGITVPAAAALLYRMVGEPDRLAALRL